MLGIRAASGFVNPSWENFDDTGMAKVALADMDSDGMTVLWKKNFIK